MIGVGTRDARKGGIRQQGMDIGDPTRGLGWIAALWKGVLLDGTVQSSI